MSVEELKQQGNAAFAAEDFDEAIEKFSKAIALDSTNHILFSNRSAAYLASGKKEEALADAQKCVEINPNWSKGFLRLGKAQEALSNALEASEAYQKGLEIEPGNPLLLQASQAMQQDMMTQIFGQLFGPDMYERLDRNPETAEFIKDPQTRAILDKIKTNPRLLSTFMTNEKIGKCIQVLSGITDEMAEQFSQQRKETEPAQKQNQNQNANSVSSSSSNTSHPQTHSHSSTTAGARKSEEVMMTAEEKEVVALKEEGSRLYKERKYVEAVKKYKEAKNKVLEHATVEATKTSEEGEEIKADNTEAEQSSVGFNTEDPTYKHLSTLYLNISAVYLTQREFQKSIKWANKAIKSNGTGNTGGFEFLSKCYVRIAKCEMQLDNFSAAVASLKSAQMESDSREIRNLIRECKTKLREKRQRDMYSPEKALELKTEANKSFAEKDFPKAISLYTEALAHDKDNVDIINNRAYAYQSLGEFQQCITDCEEVIRLVTSKGINVSAQTEPGKELLPLQKSVVKAYIRMARTYTIIHKFHYGAHYFNLAGKLDPTNPEIAKGMNDIYVLFGKSRDSIIATREQNLSDKLIKDLMADPQVNHALTMLQSNPGGLNNMLSDKYLGPKLTCLMLAGII